MAEKKKFTMTLVASVQTTLGSVELFAKESAEGGKSKCIDYVRWTNVFDAPVGAKPALTYQRTVSEHDKLAPAIASIPAEGLAMMLSFQLPELMKAAKKTPMTTEVECAQIVKDSFYIVDAMLWKRADSRPKATTERKPEDYLTRYLSDCFLIAAGTTGEIPEVLDIAKLMVKAREMAEKKAVLLGKDKINQFRLTKEKVAKAADSKDAPKDSADITTEEDAATEEEIDAINAEIEAEMMANALAVADQDGQ